MSTDEASNLLSATSKSIGDAAEVQACVWLKAHGHTIVARNWRNRWAELDIVSECDGVYYFVEVKYRSSTSAGPGYSAVTKSRLQQLVVASEHYCRSEAYSGPRQLLVLSLSGKPPVVDHVFDDIYD